MVEARSDTTRRTHDRPGAICTDYHAVMSQCTAPAQGHRTASGAAACPVHGGRGYGYYCRTDPITRRLTTRRRAAVGAGSISCKTRPSWSPSTSSVTYTPAEVWALTSVRHTVELQARQKPDLRDVFLCHAWDDRRGVAKELNDLLVAEDVSVWFSEEGIVLGQPFLREIDRGLAKSRTGIGSGHGMRATVSRCRIQERVCARFNEVATR